MNDQVSNAQRKFPENNEHVSFDSIVQKSKDNIASHDKVKRGPGRPRKNVSGNWGGNQGPASHDTTRADSPAPLSSGIPQGTFGGLWGFIGDGIAQKTRYEAFRLNDEKKALLDGATEKAAAKHFPIEGIEEQPLKALILTVCLVFGPPTFGYFMQKKEIESANDSESSPQTQQTQQPLSPQGFPVEKFN